ncbi:transcription initiation factor TFIIIB [Gracilibacillus alcaliphilus]|uniref:transcription initiation factor TFIIIB n=1 Tax=Gracilibacillus alcaliphilus TaxID=1401441 RepID=UPI00195BC828|nr:transcription initiation factor TFIIIB [Gracilibacillus alcaliphilus]MBM7675441.1 putative Zn finger protein [Gracilibacillus alcaliphilus]
MNNQRKQCPNCSSTELGIGKQTGYAVVQPENKMSFGSNITHLICTECGLVIESFVKKPGIFKDTLY